MLFIHVFVVLLSSFFKLDDTSKLAHCLTINNSTFHEEDISRAYYTITNDLEDYHSFANVFTKLWLLFHVQ
jgi:hypothetical protein